MNRLEVRLRRWLCAYPKEYRAARAEEILATLLDAASEGDDPTVLDLGHLLAHAAGVRVRAAARRWRNRAPMPQPVRLVTWLLVGAAVVACYDALSAHNGPRNPESHMGVLTGLVFLALNLLVQTRRRAGYVATTGVLVIVASLGLVAGASLGAGLVLAAPYLVLVLLLVTGWRRYVVAIKR